MLKFSQFRECFSHLSDQMVSRCKFQSSSEVGAYALVTNSYALLPISNAESFFSTFQSTLSDQIPIIYSNIGGTNIVGRLTVGNKRGLILPLTTTNLELETIRNNLPESVEVAKIEERYSALGNVIACNDKIALVHLDNETIEVLENVLGVETIKCKIANESLVGSYSVLSNKGCAVTSKATVEEIDNLSDMLDLNVEGSTVNSGIDYISSGICVNDFALFCGYNSSALEIANLTRIFKIESNYNNDNDIIDIDNFVSLI